MIIAEIGTSHGTSFEKCEKLIKQSIESGADAVKLQWVYAEEILHPETGFVDLPGGKIKLFDRFKQLEVPADFYKKARDLIHSYKAKFICSPFGLKSLSELLALEPDAVKIASPELNHFPMLKALADFRSRQKASGITPVPVILSSGVSTLADIEKAISILGTENITLLHCVTSYPAPETEYNVKVLQSLNAIFGIPVGISDHSLNPILVPVLATACGGTIIEKHITLSRKTDGLDDPVALEGEQFAFMVHAVKQTKAAINRYGKDLGLKKTIAQLSEQFGEEKVLAVLGDGIKKIAPAEKDNYGRTNRSLHFLHDMKKGETIKETDIAVLRTEKVLTPGLSPEFLKTVTGAKLSCDVSSGAGVELKHIISY